MITVYLHGLLKKYGEKFSLDAKSPAEAVKALCVQIPGLEKAIKRGNWHILRGKLEEQDSVSEEALTLEFGAQKEMHLMPAAEGAGGGNGVFSVIIGIVLIAVAIFYPPAAGIALQLGMAGAGMVVGGIVMMTTKVPDADMTAGQDQKSSFLLSRPGNSTVQGSAIPRGYGRCMVGSVQVSVSVVAEDIKPDRSDVLQNAVDAALGVWRQR